MKRNENKNFKNVFVHHPNDLPPEAIGERVWIQKYGFRSLLFVPMVLEKKLYGTIGFYGKVDEELGWSEQYILLLKLIYIG